MSLPAAPVPPSHPTASHRGTGATAGAGVGLGKGRLGSARGFPLLAHFQTRRREEGTGGEGSPIARITRSCDQPAPDAVARESPRENNALKCRSGTGSVRGETASPSL